MKDPTTVLMYEGQSLAERHLAQQVTLLNADNDSITIQIDAMTPPAPASYLLLARPAL